MEVRPLELDDLDLSLGRLRRLPQSQVERMEASLRSKGQLSPIVVARQGERAVLIDGFVRCLAARRLGLERLAAEIVEVTVSQMKAQVYLRNRERGLHLVEECRLVRELVEVDSLSQVEVGDLLERHKSWVCRRLGLARRLSPSLLVEADLGRLTAGSLSRLAELPARNQEEVWAAAQRDGVEGGQIGLLARLWQQAPDPDARAWVVAHPALALAHARGKTEASTDPRLGPAGDEVHGGLVALDRLAVLARAHHLARTDCTEALDRVEAALGGRDGK